MSTHPVSTPAAPAKAQDKGVGCDALLALLNEAYIFIAMKHRACDPWRNALDEWQERVEKQTGWSAFDQIEKSRANNVI